MNFNQFSIYSPPSSEEFIKYSNVIDTLSSSYVSIPSGDSDGDGISNFTEVLFLNTEPSIPSTWQYLATDLGNNWRWNNWLGYFSISNSAWMFHQEHEWLYV
jgi:hypothetical protein